MQLGSEFSAYPFIYFGTPFIYSPDWFRYVMGSDPDWDPTSVTLADLEIARAQDAYNISTWNANLSAFRNTSGRLLTYHGTQDRLISSDNSERYYHPVAETMDLSPTDLDDFCRYFFIGGMAHCRGGPSAWNIGAYATGGTVSTTPTDPESNVLTVMLAWVEKGKAPGYVRRLKFVNNTVSNDLASSRKHRRFPRRNVTSALGTVPMRMLGNIMAGNSMNRVPRI